MNKTNGSRYRKFCDCGNEATIVQCNARVCQRCYDIDSHIFHHAEYTWDKPRIGHIHACNVPGVDSYDA